MKLLHFKKLTKKYWAEILLAFLAIVMASFMAWWVYNLGLTKALTDQNAHLNFSKLVLESLTPGISQLGFWPPLLHILMIPFVSINSLYKTGFAGFFTLLPFLVMGTIFLYKIVLRLTNKKILGFVTSILFILNPYILYYTVTPMAEVLFITNLIGVAYFLLSWLDDKLLKDLLLCGLFITLACLSRFEGLILIPLVGIIILLSLIKERISYHKIEALFLLFILPAMVGAIAILVYSWVFSGNPLTFAGGGWWLRSPLEETARSKQDIILSLQYLFTASNYMFTKSLAIVAVISFVISIFISSKKFTLIVISLILFSPFLFDLLSLFKGIPLLVPEFPLPYKIYVNKMLLPEAYLNERYGLYWIGFVVIIPMVLVGILLQKSSRSKFLNILATITGSVFISGLVLLSLYNLYNVSFVEKFKTIRYNMGVPSNEQIEAARYLNKSYDYGKILLTRVDNDPILVEAEIPLKNYVSEGNFRFHDQVVKQPWLFARWVIIYNQDDPQGDKWAKQKEPLSVKYSDSKIFHKYYKLIFENDKKRIYKINEDAVRNLAEEEGYNSLQIPSINSQLTQWDPQTIYSKIQTPDSSQVARKILPLSKPEIKSKLKTFYESDLKSYYKDGFYIDSQNTGNSESQSYALLQSYWVGDKETFDKVWEWTKKNLQRKTDHLFSWVFTYNLDTKKVKISDNNSATDADTDIAYALIRAGKDWKNEEYLKEARLIIKDLWEVETASASGERYVLAGSWANTKSQLVLNPSYFSPFAYREFAKYDVKHNWEPLINDGYDTLSRLSGVGLGKDINVFLPPNWAVLSKINNDISAFKEKSDSLDYSYDAFRTFWRVAMDQLLYPNDQAKSYLEKASIFKTEWEKNKQLCTIYQFNEGATSCEFVTSTLTGPLAVLSVTEPRIANEVVDKYFVSGGNITIPESTSFYHKSWHWFGLMLWTTFDNQL